MYSLHSFRTPLLSALPILLSFLGACGERALLVEVPGSLPVPAGSASSGAAALAPVEDAAPPRIEAAPSLDTAEPPIPHDGVRYCTATVTHWDEHTCIRAITPEQQKRREFSYKLVYRAGKVVRFEQVNGRGFLRDLEDESSAWDYTYTTGRLSGARGYDSKGILQVVVKVEDGGKLWRRFDPWGRPKPLAKSRAVSIARTFDVGGRVTSSEYLDRDGKLVPNKDGVCRVETKRDARGSVVEQRYFDDLRKPALDERRVHGVDILPGPFDEGLEQRMIGLKGEAINNADGWHLERTRTDDVGQAIDVEAFNVQGAPVVDADHGAFRWHAERDAHGKVVHGSYFDVAGEPTINKWEYHKWHAKFDDRGRVVEWSFFGTAGEPVEHKDGHHKKRMSFDGRGYLVLSSYWDSADEKFTFKSDYSTFHTTYDARGNVVRDEYRDEDGELVDQYGMYAVRSSTRDEFDQVVRFEYRDSKGQPAEDWRGVATELSQYRSDGALKAVEYLGKNGNRLERLLSCIVRVGFAADKAVSALPTEARRQIEALDEGSTRDRGRARRQAEAARAALLARRPAEVVFAQFSDGGSPASARSWETLSKLPTKLADAVRRLKAGGVSPIVDHEGALWVLRVESEL